MKQKLLNKALKFAPYFLIGLMAIMLIVGAKNDSATNDESAHIGAGWSYARLGVYRLNDEHPPLMKLLSGTFLLPLKLNFPVLYQDDQATANLITNNWDQWKFGDSLMYESDNNLDALLLFARMPAILMTLGVAYLVFLWTKKLTNSRSASIVALTLAVFSPIMLAHGRLANTDAPLTFFYFLFFYVLWWFTEKPNLKRAIILGLSAGATLAVKFSAPLIAPIAMVLIIIKLIVTSRPYPKLKTVGLLLVSIIFGALALWLPYAISQRNEIANSNPYQLKQLLNKKTVSAPLVKAIILPADMYWQGFNVVSSHSKDGHPSYLNGETHTTGHMEYFPITFLLKTPLTHLFLLLVSFFSLWLTFRKNSFGWMCVLLPIIGYFAATLFNNIHIGVRHLMPIYPLTFIMASAGTYYLIKFRAWNWLVGLLMIFYIADSALHFPSYMAYFNQLIGSNHNHSKYLSDSNIDWYQDQKRMAKYLTENNISVIHSNTPQNPYKINSIQVISPTDFQDALPGEYIVSAGWDNRKLFNRAEYRLVKHIGFSTYLYQKN